MPPYTGLHKPCQRQDPSSSPLTLGWGQTPALGPPRVGSQWPLGPHHLAGPEPGVLQSQTEVSSGMFLSWPPGASFRCAGVGEALGFSVSSASSRAQQPLLPGGLHLPSVIQSTATVLPGSHPEYLLLVLGSLSQRPGALPEALLQTGPPPPFLLGPSKSTGEGL